MKIITNTYRIVNISVLATLLIIMATLRFVSITPGRNNIVVAGRPVPSLCLASRITGRPCPGCGITRSLHYFMQGNFDQAVNMHPSALWLAALIAAQTAYRLTAITIHKRCKQWWKLDAAASTVTLLLAAYVPVIVKHMNVF